MRLLWTERARDDLREIGRYIAHDKPMAASRWLSRLRLAARQAGDMPMLCRKVPEIGRDDVREIQLRTYRIVYRILDDQIHVLTVFEGHRRLEQDIIEALK